MSSRINMEGCRVGKITVLEYAFTKNKKVYWKCRCDCGTVWNVSRNNLRTGQTISCGCHRDANRFKHGMVNSKEYRAWVSMKTRCFRKTNKFYKNYGGRGVTVSPRWVDSFNNFIEDVGTAPSELHSLDRIDVNGHYEPGNVKWSTRSEQARNRTDTRFITHSGETLCISDWVKRFPVSHAWFYEKVGKLGPEATLFHCESLLPEYYI